MVPWLPNLSLFCHSGGDESNPDLVKTRAVIRLLIDLTVARTDVSYIYIYVCVYNSINVITVIFLHRCIN